MYHKFFKYSMCNISGQFQDLQQLSTRQH